MENSRVIKLKDKMKDYYNKSKSIHEDFGGPSIYFHRECINAGKEEYLGDRHIEMVYATLTAWGMHKMGKTKTKLVEFKKFKKSILDKKSDLIKLKSIRLNELEKNKEIIKNIFLELEVSKSNSHIVTNSKTMYHLLWNIIPPIDREHTIRFFFKKDFLDKNGKWSKNNVSINSLLPKPKRKPEQFDLFWKILIKIKEIIGDDEFKRLVESEEFKKINMNKSREGFNLSPPKIVDDLIMAFVKDVKNTQNSK